jgi:rhamnopyranosyl-N-acetylglucosaminyl-diphospho-decaprenol beta-1,3/1,4-galactofuranosyltransferase
MAAAASRSESVCAFVLTRDRRELLVECLGALLAQTVPVDEIVVLDNASTDGTREHLAAAGLLERVRFERRERNTGGAGGYREGIRLCLEAQTDWIWLMDDDAEPRPDALERLLVSPAAAAPSTAAVCAAVVHPDGSIDAQHRCRMGRFITPLPPAAYAPGRYAAVDCASFVGLCMCASAARGAGIPLAEFFIGYDDAEYSLRLRRHGDIVLVPEAELLHKVPIGGGGASTRRARALNRLLGLAYAPVPWPAFWRDLYRVRNFMWIKHRYGRVSPVRFALLTAVYLGKSLLYDPQPVRRAPWIVRYALKGRRGDWSAVSPETWAR